MAAAVEVILSFFFKGCANHRDLHSSPSTTLFRTPAARAEPAGRRGVRGAGRGRRRGPAAAAARPEGAAAARRGKRELRARGRAARPHPGARVIDLSLLPDGGIAWLDASGPKASIVLSTRIRPARNLQGYVFGQRARDADRTAVLTPVEEAGATSDRPQRAA